MSSEHFEYRGVIHMHSRYSDGNDTVEQIMEEANNAAIDFVVLTDHDTLKAKEEGKEKWHDSSLLIVGTEITPRHNHFITFGVNDFEGLKGLNTLSPQEIINTVKQNGWVGFIAHPDYTGSETLGVNDYSWNDWEVTGFTGISVWHLVSNWLGELDNYDRLELGLYENFEQIIKAPSREALERWDKCLLERRTTGIAELDNHSSVKKFNDSEIVIFPLKKVFKTLINHVLLNQPLSKDPLAAKKQIFSAFKDGNLYICNESLGEAEDFSFTVESGDKVAGCGNDLVLKSSAELEVSLPTEATIRLIYNGKLAKEVKSFELVEPVSERGYYRVEVYKDQHCWVITNPIYII